MLFRSLVNLALNTVNLNHDPVPGLMNELAAMPLLMGLLIVAVTPAICEEVAFRGYMQARQRTWPLWRMALVNGLFFGIIHMNLHQFAYAFVLGAVFVLMVHYTRTVWAAMLSHFIINGTQLLLFMAAQRMGRATAALDTMPEGVLLSQGVMAVLSALALSVMFLPVAALLFWAFVCHNNQRNAVLASSLPIEGTA